MTTEAKGETTPKPATLTVNTQRILQRLFSETIYGKKDSDDEDFKHVFDFIEENESIEIQGRGLCNFRLMRFAPDWKPTEFYPFTYADAATDKKELWAALSKFIQETIAKYPDQESEFRIQPDYELEIIEDPAVEEGKDITYLMISKDRKTRTPINSDYVIIMLKHKDYIFIDSEVLASFKVKSGDKIDDMSIRDRWSDAMTKLNSM